MVFSHLLIQQNKQYTQLEGWSITHCQKDYTYKSCIFSRLLVTSSFAFCVIAFEPIEVQTRSAPQNDRLNLVFVKGIYVKGGKLARNGQKTAISGGGWSWRFPKDDDICTTFLKSLCSLQMNTDYLHFWLKCQKLVTLKWSGEELVSLI